MHVDITARSGTTSLVSTTWADTPDTVNTRRDTRSDDQGDVDYLRCLHINLLIGLLHFNLKHHITYSSTYHTTSGY